MVWADICMGHHGELASHDQRVEVHPFKEGSSFPNLLKSIQLASKSPRMNPSCQHHGAKLCVTSIQSAMRPEVSPSSGRNKVRELGQFALFLRLQDA